MAEALNPIIVDGTAGNTEFQFPGELAGGDELILTTIGATAGDIFVFDGVSRWNPGAGGGAGTGDLNYVHSQVSVSSSWAVTHNLGKFPSVEAVDSGGSVIIPDVLYVDVNHVTLSFGAATSGKAYFN